MRRVVDATPGLQPTSLQSFLYTTVKLNLQFSRSFRACSRLIVLGV